MVPKGEEDRSTEAVVDLICNDTAAFIGPEGSSCHTEAMVASSKNRTMISYRCNDAVVSSKEKYPTFTRMEPPDTQVIQVLLRLRELTLRFSKKVFVHESINSKPSERMSFTRNQTNERLRLKYAI